MKSGPSQSTIDSRDFADVVERSGGPSIDAHDFLPCVAVVAMATVMMLPVFLKGFPAGFDAVRHYRWTSQFIDAIADGALYPHWLPTGNEGQGSPSTLFYPPLTFYVAAAFSRITGDTLRAMSFSCWLGLGLSGLTMYVFARSALSRGPSLVAAALFMAAPYHLLDLYQGSSVSEFWSFAWAPLLLLAAGRVIAGRGLEGVPFLAASFALLVLTHVPVAYLTTITLAVYAIVLTRSVRALLRAGAGLALGAGISSVFLIPVLFENRFVKLFFKFSYSDYFQFEHLRTALTSPRFPPDRSPYSYLLDTDVIALALVGLVVASSILIWIRRRSPDRDENYTRIAVAVLVVTIACLFMTTRLSAPLWRFVPGLSFLFFPYRWLVVACAGACFLGALAVQISMRGTTWRVARLGVMTAIVLVNVGISALAVARASSDPGALAESLSRRDTREYRSVWWDGQLRRELWLAPWIVKSGDAEVRAIDDAGIKQSYSANANVESVVVFRPLYFPGWVARLDGKPIGVSPSEDGHLQLAIEPGAHALTLTFEDTWPRTAGKVVSGISLLVAIALAYRNRRARRVFQ